MIVFIGQEIEIEIAIQIVVAECWCMASFDEVQAERLGLFREHGLTVIDEQLVWGAMIADIDVEVSIVLDIDHGHPRAPGTSAGDAGFLRDILESEVSSLPEETIVYGPIGKEQIGQLISIDVSDCHSTDNHGRHVESTPRMRRRVFDRIDVIEPSLLWIQFGEHRFGTFRARSQGIGGDLAGRCSVCSISAVTRLILGIATGDKQDGDCDEESCVSYHG